MKTNYDNKGKSDQEIFEFWANKIKEYGIPQIHPSFSDDEEYIMSMQGAVTLRMAEPDKRNKAPHHLVLREAMRRYTFGMESRKNNYPKLIVRSFERLHENILNEKLELAEGFTSKPDAHGSHGGAGRKAGTEENGLFWVPYFRQWRVWEEYMILQPIGALKAEWNGLTRERGKQLAETTNELYEDAVGRIRKEWIETGYVDTIIDNINKRYPELVPINYAVKDKLALGFKSKGKKIVKKIIITPTVAIDPVQVLPLTLVEKIKKFLGWNN